MKIAIQGKAGSFHAAAAAVWASTQPLEFVECSSFLDVFHELETRHVDTVIAAVENTVYGSINEVYQLIDTANVPIVGEIKLPIAQQLIAHAGTKLKNIKEIYSHPVALAQCQQTLARLVPNAKLVEYFDTAAAVEFVRSSDKQSLAAIGSSQAAALHELEIIHPDVHDSPHNMTRFLVLSRQNSVRRHTDRTSVVVTTNHQPGALVEVLQLFAQAKINLAKLQSQPILGQPWQYKFFIVADDAGDKLDETLRAIESTGHSVKLLGKYRRSR